MENKIDYLIFNGWHVEETPRGYAWVAPGTSEIFTCMHTAIEEQTKRDAIALDTFRAECRQDTPRNVNPTCRQADNCATPCAGEDWHITEHWLLIAAKLYRGIGYAQHALACQLAIGG